MNQLEQYDEHEKKHSWSLEASSISQFLPLDAMSTLRERIEAAESFLRVYPAPCRDILLSVTRPRKEFGYLFQLVKSYDDSKDIHQEQLDDFIAESELSDKRNELLRLCKQAILEEEEDNKNHPEQKFCSFKVSTELMKKRKSNEEYAFRIKELVCLDRGRLNRLSREFECNPQDVLDLMLKLEPVEAKYSSQVIIEKLVTVFVAFEQAV